MPRSQLPKPFPRRHKVEWQFKLNGVENPINNPLWASFPKWKNLQDLSNMLLDNGLIQSLSLLIGNPVLLRGKTGRASINVMQMVKESESKSCSLIGGRSWWKCFLCHKMYRSSRSREARHCNNLESRRDSTTKRNLIEKVSHWRRWTSWDKAWYCSGGSSEC